MDIDLLSDFTYQAIMTTLWVAMPPMLVALGVGLAIAIIQALTQIQEMTLTFVPKIILVLFSLIFFMPFMLEMMLLLMELTVSNISNIE